MLRKPDLLALAGAVYGLPWTSRNRARTDRKGWPELRPTWPFSGIALVDATVTARDGSLRTTGSNVTAKPDAQGHYGG